MAEGCILLVMHLRTAGELLVLDDEGELGALLPLRLHLNALLEIVEAQLLGEFVGLVEADSSPTLVDLLGGLDC